MDARLDPQGIREFRLFRLQFAGDVHFGIQIEGPIINQQDLDGDIALLGSMVENEDRQGWIIVLIFYCAIPEESMVQLLDTIGRLRGTTKLYVVAETSIGNSPQRIPVRALVALFRRPEKLELFHFSDKRSQLTLAGNEGDYALWANALGGCSSLKTFICRFNNNQRDVAGLQPQEAITRCYSNEISPWDPVIRTVLENNIRALATFDVELYEDRILSLQEETMNLIAQGIRHGIRIDMHGSFKLPFSEMQHVLAYCSLNAVGFFKNVQINFFAESPANRFLHNFIDESKFENPLFRVTVCQSNVRSIDMENIYIGLEKSLVKPELIQFRPLKTEHRLEVTIKCSDERALYLYRKLHSEDLFDFDPLNATDDQWIQMMSALGSICLGIHKSGRLDYDLNPLHYFVSNHLDKVIDMASTATNSVISPMAALTATNASLTKRIQSLTAKLESYPFGASQSRE